MANALFADISSYQTVSDMAAYAAFSRQGDGLARLAMKATEGVGYKDARFESFWTAAMAAKLDMAAVYHYARPDLNPGPTGAQNEARWFASVVGNRLRPQDRLMLDFEQNEDATWALSFALDLQEALPRPVKLVLYDGLSRFNQFFAADPHLPLFYDAALAMWPPFMQDGPPAAPPGWKLLWWQFTDNTLPRIITPVPGISMPVDVNMWLAAPVQPVGGSKMLIINPMIPGRQDLFYINANSVRHIVAPTGDFTQGVQVQEALGNPGTEIMLPETLCATWDSQGDAITVIVAGISGTLYVAKVDAGGFGVMPWTPVADGASVDVPAASGEPLAQKIVSAVAALG